jgi:predicted P-loop ATPase
MSIQAQHEPALKGIFAWNAFSKTIMLMREPPWTTGHDWKGPRATVSEDLAGLYMEYEKLWMKPTREHVMSAMVAAAQANKQNPVQDYLNGLTWDGVDRINGCMEDGETRFKPWLVEFMGAEDTPINRAFGKRWLISAVARAMDPGCKVDTMLVFEGRQGLNKSTAVETLATIGGQSYFDDQHLDISNKDSVLSIAGKWIIEMGELDSLMRSNDRTTKAWLSRKVDRCRVPYGRVTEDFPRTCVFIGTYNPDGAGWLKDTTGGRRFWPVVCGEIDIVGLRAEASQLWAQAVSLWRDKEQWWLTGEEDKLAEVVQAERCEEDPWEDRVREIAETQNRVTTTDILNKMGVEVNKQNPHSSRRVAVVLRKMGFVKKTKREGGDPHKVFVREGV